MEQNSTLTRFHALDGIRAVAIILVVINHVNNSYLSHVLPVWLARILFSSGIVGVSLFFVLSGFLMMYIYPNPQSGQRFLQKRYTRIFPLFLTTVAVMVALRELPNLVWYWRLFILLLFPFFSYVLWVHVIKRYASVKVKKYIFLGFVLLQIVVGAFYLFWVMRHPPIVFNQQIPAIIREGTIGLVNGTLTLPLGNYIPMLEGIYWSLVAEVFFYILYPFVCIPFIQFLIPKKRWIKIVLILTLIPFFIGMDMLSHKVFLLSMLQLPFCYYFVAGIALGYLYKHHEDMFHKMHRVFPGIFSSLTVLLFLCVLFMKVFIFDEVSSSFISLAQILWSFPIAFVMAISLDQKTLLSKILSSRILVFIGTISYSVYLIHTPILHMVEDSFHATNALTNLLQMIVTISITIALSLLWYHWLEKPYFKRNKEKEVLEAYHHNHLLVFIRRPAFLFPVIACFYIIAIFSAYESSFNFFSIQAPFTNVIFKNPKIDSRSTIASMKQYPKVDFQITSEQDNFEIVMMHIIPRQTSKIINVDQSLIFHIKEVGQKSWYATSSYNLLFLGDSQLPIGFPQITNAKGKTYLVEMLMSAPASAKYLTFDTGSLEGVYKVNKTQLIKHPSQLFTFIFARVLTVIRNQEAQLTFYLFLPILFLFIVLSFSRKKFALLNKYIYKRKAVEVYQ
ncbi:MAG TPA: acyltransferase [Candidatus Acidoferrales bacterium]|nr:acyltransferase [Candidatus Acidoferrales bacterium]